ncbi:MAG: DUF1573 domain-containing protein [Phycisphaerae bacterium]|nr:DUF1573 domain-containing protein [Phycisphaerae bacterium]
MGIGKNCSGLIFVLLIGLVPCFGEAVEGEIDCGTINVGQAKDVKFEIVNDYNSAMVIDSLSACCGNEKPTISSMRIPAGGRAELVQLVKRTKPGKFSITSRVGIKEPEEKRLSFKINGVAVERVVAMVGWEEGALKKAGGQNGKFELGTVGYDQEYLFIELFDKNGDFDLEGAISDVKSMYFSLDKMIVKEIKGKEDLHDKKPDCSKEGEISCCRFGEKPESFVATEKRLFVRLKANSRLAKGRISDDIVVEFKDGSCCYVPIVFRSVGDVYGESGSLNMGKILDGGKIEKRFKIFFGNGIKWESVGWKADGVLVNGIAIAVEEENETSEYIEFTIGINVDRLEMLEGGFVSSKIYFFEKGQEAESVRLLIYGYR